MPVNCKLFRIFILSWLMEAALLGKAGTKNIDFQLSFSFQKWSINAAFEVNSGIKRDRRCYDWGISFYKQEGKLTINYDLIWNKRELRFVVSVACI